MRKPPRRRRLSMTSLIDVIFLLLLFFMLSSSFSRFAEIELSGGGSGAAGLDDSRPLFLRLGPDSLDLNGRDLAFEDLQTAFDGQTGAVLVSLKHAVTSQRLVDLLGVLRTIPGLQITVLEQS